MIAAGLQKCSVRVQYQHLMLRFDVLIAGLVDKGYSRREIALQSGLSRQTIWRLETGEVRQPGFETIERLRHLDQKTPGVTHMLRKIG